MTKLHKKLLVIVCAIICSLCLCFGITACKTTNGDEHEHIYIDGVCDCGAEDPDYDPNGGNGGNGGDDTHDHFDEDDDEKCDECGADMHEHKFSTDWTFNENKHWHIATCSHFTERSDYNNHKFEAGVCACGVKESEVEVYALYKSSPEYDDEGMFFTEWLAWLESKGIVSVEVTASGDGVYHYTDGHSEVRFLGERTVKVKAVVDGEPLADVWFMVTMYTNNEYYQSNGTVALGIAKTDSKGIAEITFRPVGGYSSETIEYRIRIAEAKDIAVFENIAEESAKPIPNRYEVKSGNLGFEFEPCEVSENATSDDIAATIEFNYSKGWNAYNTIYLPYRRYWADQVNGTDIQEVGTIYNFTSSGENLFDYFYFSPQLYDYSQGGTLDKNLQIVENAKIACSGVYKISYTVDKNANAQLYFWDEDGVNLDTSHQTKADGTPADTYLTQKVEGQSGFVTIKISQSLGLRLYQLGIITDTECNVNITVERISDFGVGADYTFEWDNEAQNSQLNITIGQVATLKLGLNGVPAGLYVLTLPDAQVGSTNINRYYVWTDDDEQKFAVGMPQMYGHEGLTKGIIRITEDTNFIYLQNNGVAAKNIDITLEKYELPTVTNEFTAVPVTPATYQDPYTLSLTVTPGSYRLRVWIVGDANGGKDKPLYVYIDDKQIELTEVEPYFAVLAWVYTYYGDIEIAEQDKTITIKCSTEYSFVAGVEFIIPHECKNVCPECNKCLTECKEPECADKCAGHGDPDVPEDGIYADLGELTLSAGQTSGIDIKNLQAKNYYLIAETDSAPASGIITAMIYGKSNTAMQGDMFTPVSNVYKCVLAVQEDWFRTFAGEQIIRIEIKNSSDEELHITKLQVVEYEEFTIQADQEYEFSATAGANGYWYMPIDESLSGKKVRITVTNFTGTKDLRVYYNNGTKATQLGALTSTNSFVGEMTIPEGITALSFINMNSLQFQNVVIKFELVEE